MMKRSQVAREIYETELSYVASLRALVDVYFVPLKSLQAADESEAAQGGHGRKRSSFSLRRSPTKADGALLTATAKRLLACTRHGADENAAAARAACKACYGAALRGDAAAAAAALEPLFPGGGV